MFGLSEIWPVNCAPPEALEIGFWVYPKPSSLCFPSRLSLSMASSLSTLHHLSSSLCPRNIDNAKLSSTLFHSPINLSSNPNISLQFLNKKQSPLLSSTPRFLTVIAMAPPKPGGKAKKGSTNTYMSLITFDTRF